ncbi:MAG: imidazoleglycerol-phosphate dehydratase, partial [Parasporobacterium sp.]|nr:imidazoleglycerol-phosphate dehydratase [Parasporobacterium sp.]
AIGDKKGIYRYADKIIPMDETLILCCVDISGRGHLVFDAEIPTEKVGTFDTELVKEFWIAFVREARLALHIKKIFGENSHHIIEGMFKAVARTLGEAASIDPEKADYIPSSKGVL